MRSNHLRGKGEGMPQDRCRWLWRCMALVTGIIMLTGQAASAKDTTASIKDAEQYAAKGDLKAAEIELRNAIRQSPQDPVLHARLAEIYLELGDAGRRSARRGRHAIAKAMRQTTCRFSPTPCSANRNLPISSIWSSRTIVIRSSKAK
jgi:cytochrome c-type biogenesis protein CcmH/NrfG